MKKMKHRLIFAIIAWVCVILLCAMIFLFSAQTGDSSSELSDGIVNELIDKDAEYEIVSFLVRKTAHFLEYAALSFIVTVALCLSFGEFKIYRKAVFMAFAFTVVYAISDEIHQLFIPGRAGRAFDVLIDSLGAAFGILICIVFVRIITKSKPK